MKKRSLLIPFLFLVVSPALPARVLTFPTLTVDANDPAGVAFTVTGNYSPSDTINVTVTGVAQIAGTTFAANAAGIIISPATTNTGAHPGQTSPNLSNTALPYGALLIGNNRLGYVPLIPASALNGLGSATPPTTVTSLATVGSLFAAGLANGTVLNLVVSDCKGCYGDNARSYRISQVHSTSGSNGTRELLVYRRIEWEWRRSNTSGEAGDVTGSMGALLSGFASAGRASRQSTGMSIYFPWSPKNAARKSNQR